MKKEKWELAYDDYLDGMKYKDIAAKYEVTLNTVKSWSQRYKWVKKCAHKKKSVHTKKVCKQVAKKMIEDNEELDEERQLFCVYYLKYHNKVKAYMKVKPDAKYDSACVMSSRWSKESAVQKEIDRLKAEMYADALLDPHDIFQKYIDIAFADLNDYLEYGREKVPVMGPFGPIVVDDPNTGEKVPVTKEINTVKFKDSAFVDGSILSEVKQGRDGASIKLADRMKALDWLANHMNMANEEQKAKVELLKAQSSRIKSEMKKDDIKEDRKVTIINDLPK